MIVYFLEACLNLRMLQFKQRVNAAPTLQKIILTSLKLSFQFGMGTLRLITSHIIHVEAHICLIGNKFLFV